LPHQRLHRCIWVCSGSVPFFEVHKCVFKFRNSKLHFFCSHPTPDQEEALRCCGQ
jgi:hypothetical protein